MLGQQRVRAHTIFWRRRKQVIKKQTRELGSKESKGNFEEGDGVRRSESLSRRASPRDRGSSEHLLFPACPRGD